MTPEEVEIMAKLQERLRAAREGVEAGRRWSILALVFSVIALSASCFKLYLRFFG